MEPQQADTRGALMRDLEQKLPRMNFYRFCQILEQLHGAPLGISESPATDPMRFAPAPDMSFPAGELKAIEHTPDYLPRPTTVRTRFLGLYGVDAILPPALLQDIVQRDEGYEVLMDFLDMFNHRVITQYYRIWLKYHYPASFISGGQDSVSQCLLGLTGLGIKGASEQIATPSSRFLALLGLVTQRTRTAEGIVGVIRVLIPHVDVSVQEFYPTWVTIDPAQLSRRNKPQLNGNNILGKRFKESNQTVRIVITPNNPQVIEGLLPGGQLHDDMMVLLRAYLGYRVDAQVDLKIPRRFLPRSVLTSTDGASRLGQTSSLMSRQSILSTIPVKINLGRYRGLAA